MRITKRSTAERSVARSYADGWRTVSVGCLTPCRKYGTTGRPEAKLSRWLRLPGPDACHHRGRLMPLGLRPNRKRGFVRDRRRCRACGRMGQGYERRQDTCGNLVTNGKSTDRIDLTDIMRNRSIEVLGLVACRTGRGAGTRDSLTHRWPSLQRTAQAVPGAPFRWPLHGETAREAPQTRVKTNGNSPESLRNRGLECHTSLVLCVPMFDTLTTTRAALERLASGFEPGTFTGEQAVRALPSWV